MKQSRITRVFQYLALTLLAFIALYPLLWAVASSLRTDEEIFKYIMPFSIHTIVPVQPTFETYVSLFRDFSFQKPVINSLVVSLISIVGSCIVNGIAAFGFATFNFKGKRWLYSLVLVSFMVPFEAIAVSLYSVAASLNWINTYYGLIVPCIADGLVLFLFVQFFREIPVTYYESARLDGAKWSTIFLYILLPLSTPVLVTGALMVFMNQWNSFLWPLLVAHGRDMRTIQVSLSDFKQEHSTNWSAMYAASVISALLPIMLFLPFQKYYVQGVTATGLKG
ncbi:MAG: carbohydrate ABC transporter permease [Candidatus Excrementavichristensenella sp.]|jgi:multiple sugar transport system permease protein